MEEQKWEDLDMDCLVNVLGRLEVGSLFLDIPFVCKSWYKASLSPLCWQHPDFSDSSNFIYKLYSEYGFLVHFCITSIIKSIIKRSNGSAVSLVLPSECPKEALIYVANECPALKYLALPAGLIFHQSLTISSLICKWKNLEMLKLEGSFHMLEILTQVSFHCKNLVSLDITLANIGNDQASTIVTLLPNITHLVLRHALLEEYYLVMILQGCKELVHFDVRDGRGFKVNDEILKLASHIRTFMYEGSREFERGEGYDEHGYYFSPVYSDYSSDEELVNSDQLSGDGELVN